MGVVDAAATRFDRTPEETSPIFLIKAEGVRGGVRRSSDSVVVCDLSNVVQVLTTSRAFGSVVVFELGAGGAGVGVCVGESEDWKCMRSVCVVFVRDMRPFMEVFVDFDFVAMVAGCFVFEILEEFDAILLVGM